MNTIEGLEVLGATSALAAQEQELSSTALGHALFGPSMWLGSIGLTVGTVGIGGVLLVDDVDTQLAIALSMGGAMIVGSGLLLVGVMSLPSWHRHQVSQEIVSDRAAKDRCARAPALKVA